MRTATKLIFKSWLSILFVAFSFLASAQTIKGKVLDANTGEPLVGAAVKLDGSFSFTKIAAGTYTFIITYIGYKATADVNSVSVAAGETKTLNFSLEPVATQMESVTICAAAGSGDKSARRLEKPADRNYTILNRKQILIAGKNLQINSFQPFILIQW